MVDSQDELDALLVKWKVESMTLTQQILERDNHQCQYCSQRAFQADHIFSRARQPDDIERDDPEYMVAVCRNCNEGKGTLPLCPESFRERIPDLNDYTPGHFWNVWNGKYNERFP